MTPRELRNAMGAAPWCGVTACGLGHMRPASGTWGSLPPVLLGGALAWGGISQAAWIAVMAIIAAVATWICVRWGGAAERAAGRKDPSQVVIDEVAGQAVALGLVWHGAFAGGGAEALRAALWTCGASFLLFRAFDVVKPWPIRGLQRFHGGLGIVVDDLAAGAAAGVVQLLLRSLNAGV
jgi:phosphatidylglycerophosphatase A